MPPSTRKGHNALKGKALPTQTDTHYQKLRLYAASCDSAFDFTISRSAHQQEFCNLRRRGVLSLHVTSKNSCPALRRIFFPSFLCKKLEIHKGFLRFLPFNLRKNLSAHHQT